MSGSTTLTPRAAETTLRGEAPAPCRPLARSWSCASYRARTPSPTKSRFKYVKTRDAVESTTRKPAEVRTLYANLIAQLALLAQHDVFRVSTEDQVSEVTVNCQLATTDRATGQEIHPCLRSGAGRRRPVNRRIDRQQCPPGPGVSCPNGQGEEIAFASSKLLLSGMGRGVDLTARRGS